MADARQRLLSAAIEHLAASGISDLSLRQLAAALGTSHRMLIYHFGSKEGLLTEVVRAVEQGQRDAMAGAEPDFVRAWERFADPALWPHERLFFEIYGQALQGRPGTTGLLDGVVTSWLDQAEAQGFDRADARLAVAAMRGLLLDLLATGDRAGTDAAAARFGALAGLVTRTPAGGRAVCEASSMDDKQIFDQIRELVNAEHDLRAAEQSGTAVDPRRLRSLEETLDQCWDLLRKRRALRDSGLDPDDAEQAPIDEVEKYLQ